jgi:hypothetical protein
MRHLVRRRTWKALLATAALATVASGCKRPAGQSIVLTKDQEQQIAENVLAAPPTAMEHKMEVHFEDKITLLGYDIKGEPKKGGAFDLVMYWRVDQPVAGDWKIFVHFEAPGKRRQPFDHYGVGGLYPVGNWKKGEVVRDIVHVEVPADWPDGPTQIMVGFFDWGALTKANQDRRLKVETGKGLADDRVLLTTLTIRGAGGEKAGGEAQVRMPVAPAPVYDVARASQAPSIDGKLDDGVWQNLKTTAPFQQPDGKPLDAALNTSARLAWDDDNLYVAVTTRDSDVRNDHKDNDTTLWEGDDVELFLQLPGAEGQYVELQWAANGAKFDAKFTGHRQPEWPEAAKFDSGVKHAVVVDGSLGGGEADRGFTVEAAIPWKGLGLSGAPAVGTKIPANLYRIDDKGTHDLSHMGTWAPVGADFHKLEGAGTLVLQGSPRAAEAPTGKTK